jgi:hypothetical protein
MFPLPEAFFPSTEAFFPSTEAIFPPPEAISDARNVVSGGSDAACGACGIGRAGRDGDGTVSIDLSPSVGVQAPVLTLHSPAAVPGSAWARVSPPDG